MGIVYTKFLFGAWLVVVAIPIFINLFLAIAKHYRHVAESLSVQDVVPCSYVARLKSEVVSHPAVIVVGQLNRGTIEALDYARIIADKIVAIHVELASMLRRLGKSVRIIEMADDILSFLDKDLRERIKANTYRDWETDRKSVV